jgi:hypothetical protein
MPDNIVNLSFSGTFDGSGSYSGNVNVDYSTNLATGSISAEYNGYLNDFDLSSGVSLNATYAPNYGILAQPDPTSIIPAISVSWTGQAPETLTLIQYYYPGYSFPANAFEPAVTTTVISVCLVTGCLIATERGDVPVERLAAGDMVMTSSGALRPVRWIGHRSFDCSRDERARRLRPVRIVKDAFGAGKPRRDTLVSPGHAICPPADEEILVPACDLINGATIAQVDRAEVVYWHVELDSHDLIFANGLPVESYLDVGNRSFFAGVAGLPGTAASASATCRPLTFTGEILQAVRARLRACAKDLNWSLRDAPMSELCLVAGDRVLPPRLEGERAWFTLPAGFGDVWLRSDASAPVHVSASIDGRMLGVEIAELAISCDGERRSVALDDARLAEGFYEAERRADGSWRRWTNGRARLPAALWNGCDGGVALEFRITSSVPRWVAPAAEVDAAA